MDITKIVQAFFALIFVLSLIGAFAYLMKRFGNRSISGNSKEKNLDLLEVKIIDAKTKLALAKCKDQEYLILIGADGAQVLNQEKIDKKPKNSAPRTQKDKKVTKK